ncbi:hypothetical protein [Oceanobacillus picturae]|uniref:hypothetical protein n=1 Tax=Oceanobacillus picturae TaxID=171693 RepID=UPI000E6A07BD|nr:hypothetical protein [Oceanobacillus picturae]RIU91154.1 hypothetical protein D1864_12100 [Oceanobacillus picturae]
MRGLLVITILFSSLLVLSSCTSSVFQDEPSEKAKRYHENYEIIGKEKEEVLDEMNISETIFDISDRDNPDPEMEGDYHFDVANEEEFTLPSGRYWFTGDISGNIYIYDEKDHLLIHEIIGNPGVSGFVADVNDSHTIRIDGLESVAAFKEGNMGPSNELSAGIWHVGTDIAPGSYTIKPVGGFGHVMILDPNEEAQIFEMIGSQSVSTESEMELENGQVVRITGISLIELERVEN